MTKSKIYKWNVYLANVPFLEISGQKIRPVIPITKVGRAVYIIPLTTNLEQKTDLDIAIELNNHKGLIKVGNLQRIDELKFIKPMYSIHTKKVIRINHETRKIIQQKLIKLLINTENE
ncbi:MAG: type II toxin-antitoxin system PemK/MazF family toxin [Spiroplasma ixodetis]|nr:type II toxin-antitoxin system PemK/MazF family toxin [Spiroplasma ixodetis]